MIYLVDTNVLLRFADRSNPVHRQIRTGVRRRRAAGHFLQVTSQNCVEFWNALTRPVANNGWGLAPSDANRKLRLIERLFPLVADSPATYAEWRRLVVAFNVSGVQVHDARLVAAMKVHSITHILTFNKADFSRYATEGIVTEDPTL